MQILRIALLIVIGALSIYSKGAYKVSPMHQGGKSGEILSRILKCNEKEIEIDYIVSEYTTENVIEQNHTRLIFGNCKREVSEGKPVLPYIVSKILLPLDRGIESISLILGDSITLPGKIKLEYGSSLIRFVEDYEVKKAVADKKIYESTNAYPHKKVILHSIQRKRGVPYAIIKIYPLSYYPAQQKVTIFNKVRLKIKLKQNTVNQNALCTNLKDFDLKDFENPEMITLIPDDYCYGRQYNGSVGLRGEYRYVIITNNGLKNSNALPNLNTLASERDVQGFTDTIVTVEEIYENYDGIDNPERIRNFIKDAYNIWKTEFVLLGGDINIVPARFINVVDGQVNEVASDAYYQCLDGSYNNNNNNLWGEATDGIDGGEIDFSPDVNLGRASAEDATEMSNFISKVLKYEKDKRTGNNYLTHASFVGEKVLNLKDSVSYGKFYMDQIRYGEDGHGYSTAGFIECTDVQYSTVYEYDNNWPSDGIAQQEHMRNKINSDEIGYINHLGHSTLKKNMKMYRGQEEYLTNKNPIFHYSQGCFVGRFEEDCFGERFICENRSGMWSAVLNSHWGIGRKDNTDGASQKLQREFWDAYFNEKKLYVGECMADQREDHIHRIANQVEDPERWGYFVSNLLGAPATKFRIYDDMTNSQIQDRANFNKNKHSMNYKLINLKNYIGLRLSKTLDGYFMIYSLNGKLIKKQSFYNKDYINVDISDISPGAYTFKINLDNYQIFKRVIIQK